MAFAGEGKPIESRWQHSKRSRFAERLDPELEDGEGAALRAALWWPNPDIAQFVEDHADRVAPAGPERVALRVEDIGDGGGLVEPGRVLTRWICNRSRSRSRILIPTRSKSATVGAAKENTGLAPETSRARVVAKGMGGTIEAVPADQRRRLQGQAAGSTP